MKQIFIIIKKVFCTVFYLLSAVYRPFLSFYKKAFVGVLISYGIVLYKLYGVSENYI